MLVSFFMTVRDVARFCVRFLGTAVCIVPTATPSVLPFSKVTIVAVECPFLAESRYWRTFNLALNEFRYRLGSGLYL